jgi:hypothetical protein
VLALVPNTRLEDGEFFAIQWIGFTGYQGRLQCIAAMLRITPNDIDGL